MKIDVIDTAIRAGPATPLRGRPATSSTGAEEDVMRGPLSTSSTHRRSARRRRTTPTPSHALALALALIAGFLLLRSPASFLTLFTQSDAPLHGAPPVMAGPDADHPGRLEDVVTDTDDRAALWGAAPLGEDVTQGRWGTTPARPSAPGILVEELRGGWRVESGNEEAAALAVIAAHAWADGLLRPTGTSQRTEDTGATGATGAIVAIEAVERPGAHHAVVTALVAPNGTLGALHRIAIPLVFGQDGPTLAGTPWQLPAPAGESTLSSLRPLEGTPVGDAGLIASARRALEAVGLPGERLVGLEATDGWPFIARLDGDAEGHPWLRWHLDRFVVTGLPLDRTGRTGSAPTP